MAPDYHRNNLLTPWSNPAEPQIKFPIKPFEQLLIQLGWTNPQAWLNHWNKRGGISLKKACWPSAIGKDWIWGLALPFLTLLEGYLDKNGQSLVGISGLPGCGKTSLGFWLEAVAQELEWPVVVISLDDFYWPAPELDRRMQGNPWGVPRALPGSHDLDLMTRTLDIWFKSGRLHTPKFDKALRSGRGDRCGWRHAKPKVLVIEGWFLGCSPYKLNKTGTFMDESFSPPLNRSELAYRHIVKEELKSYLAIWERFETMWQLRALDPSYTRNWKADQESTMQRDRGICLDSEALEGFVRMILAAVPQACLHATPADVMVNLNKARQLMWVGQKGCQLSASSESAIG